MVIRDQLYTIHTFEDFIAHQPNRLFELVHGEIVEKLPTQEHGVLAARLAARLTVFVEDHNLGRVAVEARHRPPDDEYNDRLPDVSFSAGYDPLVKKGAVEKMPALAIEIKSPDDSYRQMRETADFYIANGCQLVWLIFPELKTIEIHRLNHAPQTLTETESLTAPDILPGFTLPLSYLFKDLT
ncbi:MAG: Uma2 family endonuclease [Chloroflexi bacterium]|nr:Uma2 family endonuclease [Chloroflexota bacterium]